MTLSPTTLAEIDAACSAFAQEENIPGLAAGVVAGGQVYDDPWGDRVLGMTPAELDSVMGAGRLFARPPGIAFEYSNLGYGLVGRAITNVSGMPYQSYIARTILEPLGMTRTTFDAI